MSIDNDAQLSVGESVMPCPSAGFGKSACPVRRAATGNGATTCGLRHRPCRSTAIPHGRSNRASRRLYRIRCGVDRFSLVPKPAIGVQGTQCRQDEGRPYLNEITLRLQFMRLGSSLFSADYALMCG